MHDARRVGAFFSGLFLYLVAICGASVLADFHLPREIYSRLGGRFSPGVIAVESALVAVLVFILALIWSFVTLRRPRKSRRSSVSWFMCGIGAAWLGALIYGVFSFALNPRSYQSTVNLLLSSDTAPLWGLFNIIAVVSAAALAESLARRLSPLVAPSSYSRSVRTASPAARASAA